MKRIILLTIIAACTFSFSQAQVRKGTIFLGGSIYASNIKNDFNGTDKNNSTEIGFSPAIGLAVKDNLITGIRLSYSSYSYNPTNNSNDTRHGYGGAVFIRNYIPLGKSFYLFGDASANYDRSKRETTYTNILSTDILNNAGVILYPGIAYSVSKHFQLEASINNLLMLIYTKSEHSNNDPNNPSHYSNSGISFSVNAGGMSALNIGFRFMIGK
jgi:hypothetical protein